MPSVKKIKSLCALFFLIPSISFAVTLDCTRHITSGEHTGHLTTIIDKDGWGRTTFIFESNDGSKGCVQGQGDNDIRNKIINNAFLLNALVTITLDSNHTITGIGYSNK